MLRGHLDNRRLNDLVHRNARHAPMIDRAFAQQAGRAVHRLADQRVPRSKGGGGAPVSRPEHRDDRDTERGGDVHRACIVGDNNRAALDRRHEFAHGGFPGQYHCFRCDPSGNGLRKRFFATRADDEHLGAKLSGQPVGRLRKPFRQPPFGSAVGRTGIQSDQQLSAADSGFRQALRHRRFLLAEQHETGRRGRFFATQWAEHPEIVFDLMRDGASSRTWNGIGQQQPPPVRRITIALRDAGQKREQRGFERILKQDRQIEAAPPHGIGKPPLAGQSGMLPAIVIDQDMRNGRMSREQFRDRRLDQQRQFCLGEQPAHGRDGRLAHHGIADPIGASQQHPFEC